MSQLSVVELVTHLLFHKISYRVIRFLNVFLKFQLERGQMEVTQVHIQTKFKLLKGSGLWYLCTCECMFSFFHCTCPVDIFIAAPLLKAINQHLVFSLSDAGRATWQVSTGEYFRLDL